MAKYYGPREFFRLGCFIMGWILLGIVGLIVMTVLKMEVIGKTVYWVLLMTSFVFPIVGYYWKPANSVMNKVIGNKNLNYPILSLSSLSKVKLSLRKQPWYYYLPSLWRLLLIIALFYLAIRYFMK